MNWLTTFSPLMGPPKTSFYLCQFLLFIFLSLLLLTIIIQIYRQMIKHVSQSLLKMDKMNEDYNQFQTFQIYQNELNSGISNRDSLLFSQSRKADDTNKQLGQILSNVSKQDWRQYQKQRGSSIKKNKTNETIKESSQCQIVDPLAQYVISSFDPRNNNNTMSKHQISQGNVEGNICQRCRCLEDDHRKQIAFLTKNNQEFYELNKKLTQQLSQLVKNYEILQRQAFNQNKQITLLLKEVQFLKLEKQQMQSKYIERQKKYLKQKQINLKSHQKQLKIVQKINQCLQQKQKQSKEKYNGSQTTKIEKDGFKRAKTEYQCDRNNEKNNQISTMATWQGSYTKYTPRKTDKGREMYSQDKIRKQIDSKVCKLSQQKKKILSKVAKQNLTIEDLQTEIPQSALNKMGKGTVGKLTLAKANMGRSTSTFYGGSTSLVPTQKKCRIN